MFGKIQEFGQFAGNLLRLVFSSSTLAQPMGSSETICEALLTQLTQLTQLTFLTQHAAPPLGGFNLIKNDDTTYTTENSLINQNPLNPLFQF